MRNLQEIGLKASVGGDSGGMYFFVTADERT